VSSPARTVSIVTLGCARNEVDSEELAGRLSAGGWMLTDEADADVVLVNTCGFIDSAKKDSIDTVLAAAESGRPVVAVGCLAERYGAELADALPEAGAVLGFDSYADIAARLDDVAAGRTVTTHVPRDRRTLLPVSPAQRPAAAANVAVPGHAWVPTSVSRTRLDDAPVAYLKLASGCDRRCTFCAIPSFRGSFVSRPPDDVLAEAAWLASTGARELVLVSENSTSYGKDLGDIDALDALLPRLAGVDGIERIRVSYLQPAELRPSLLETIASTPKVAPYFDLSFQHASAPLLRRMRRFGSTESFLDILRRVRAIAPDAGARSNVIVGFPGETEADLAELERFLTDARLDAIGVFGYSDEDGTEAADFEAKVDPDEIAARVERVTRLAEELMSQRAEDRVGTRIEVLVEQDGPEVVGRAAHQGPDVDGVTTLANSSAARGAVVPAVVIATDGVDLVAEPAGRTR
ncbi:MAG: ribosomal protein methylthiotransferase, partial [Pseudonocardiales bacterium]|nr:ribosomal protein methylthiotransferase [Pseudonocardiales bacterium]